MAPRIRPQARPDGYGNEFHLPRLVPFAVQDGGHVEEVVLDDPDEALGVNTADDLHRAQRVIQERRLQVYRGAV